MINATQVRVGMIILHEGDLYRVMRVDHVTPGKGNSFIRTQLRNLKVGNQTDVRFASQEKVEKAHLDQREMEYLYNDGDMYNFMDTENYEQIHMSADMLGDGVKYLLPNTKIKIDYYDGVPVAIELPKTIALKVIEADPSVKRATASAQTKNAKVETGITIRVPSFVEQGDTIKVDTETGDYVERV